MKVTIYKNDFQQDIHIPDGTIQFDNDGYPNGVINTDSLTDDEILNIMIESQNEIEEEMKNKKDNPPNKQKNKT